MIGVDVGGEEDGPILGQVEGLPLEVERVRLHQDGRPLTAEVAMASDLAARIGQEELPAAATGPGDEQRGGSALQVETLLGVKLLGRGKTGLVGLALVAEPEGAGTWRLASPVAGAVVAGMSGPLVEADLLSRRDRLAVGPVAFEGVEADQQVGPAVAVPVGGNDLRNPARSEPEVGGQAEGAPIGKRGAVLLALVGEPDEALGAEGDQVEPAGSTVRQGAKTAQVSELGHVGARIEADLVRLAFQAAEDPGGPPTGADLRRHEQIQPTWPRPGDGCRLGVHPEAQGDGTDGLLPREEFRRRLRHWPSRTVRTVFVGFP